MNADTPVTPPVPADGGSARQRVRNYLIEYARMRQLSQEYIHSLHLGSDREAVLYVDDLRTLLADADRLALLDEERS